MSLAFIKNFLNINYKTEADTETKEAYLHFIAVKTSSYLPWTTTMCVIDQSLAMFTDYYVRHDPNRIYARIMPVIMGAIVFWLWFKKMPPERLVRVRRVWDITCFIDGYWLCVLCYKTPLFASTIGSIPFVVFCVTFLSMYSTRYLLLLFSISLSLFVGILLVLYGPHGDLFELNTVIVTMIFCLILNEWRNRLYFSEFSLKRQLEVALEALTAAQTRLVYTEKMAALGELTAGIAHEIQNPLNFVNNFSDLSAEAIVELDEEMKKPTRNFALEAEIFKDLKDNFLKINHHGKRISGIVKGMLAHSRSANNSEHKPANLNNLVYEHLQLAYQNVQLKNQNFKVDFITKFDDQLEPVEMIEQEIGRVLLNLFSNAFYAVQEKQKKQPAGYTPTITVSTGRNNNYIEIGVADNGTGIPAEIQKKIFQPFFTTKPTGEGTGFGLSLSYDIVKGHGGILDMQSKEGEGTTFIVKLPINKSGHRATKAALTHDKI